MIAPRNRTEHVPAPVLFRLPHLRTSNAASPVTPTPQPPTDPPQNRLTNFFLTHRDLLSKPAVMWGGMLVVACGSWLVGRHMSAPATVDVTLGASTSTASTIDPPQHSPASDLSTTEPVQASTLSETAAAEPPALTGGKEEAVAATNAAEDFYLPEDLPSPELTAATAEPGSDEVVSASATSAESTDEPSAEPEADALNQPANVVEVAANEPAVTPEAQPAPAAATPETTEVASTTTEAEPAATATAEAESTPTESESKKLRRVLSRTPYDIPDWSKYLTGANNPIKAASGTGYESGGATQPKHERAFYYEQN